MQGHSTFRCGRCRQQKPADEFPRLKFRRTRTCAACRAITEKPCSLCKIVQPIDNFRWHQCNDKTKRRDSLCRDCRRQGIRDWGQRHKHTKVLASNLRKSFGLELATYHQMVAAQNGLCAICGKPLSEQITATNAFRSIIAMSAEQCENFCVPDATTALAVSEMIRNCLRRPPSICTLIFI